ncbi:hypothetical protein Y032_0044g1048 [Ancylostoma ceylanicum]|uniref:Uncharacterized protein n=1 Tax=Ancylostoma ceylanicum TaxID=53326 RepID=A0A016UE78_9BILA|nr:hypothetical protein Y032_0044g1048 [Ancylostoma ceylanicum]
MKRVNGTNFQKKKKSRHKTSLCIDLLNAEPFLSPRDRRLDHLLAYFSPVGTDHQDRIRPARVRTKTNH